MRCNLIHVIKPFWGLFAENPQFKIEFSQVEGMTLQFE